MSSNTTVNDVACGNPRHPDGAWHRNAPFPASWQYLERFRQWLNRKRWGCSCYALASPLEDRKDSD